MQKIISHVKPIFSDDRGVIEKISNFIAPVHSALRIKSKAHSVRANHYHLHETHYTYLLSGKFEYSEKPLDNPKHVTTTVIKPGMIVKTGPKIIHTMKFLENSVMVVFSTTGRTHEGYEKDIRRVTPV
jgi:quercetin dioxygenase-like cupin family protein